MTNYSIIIPHKNIPELLKRCLASIPRREDVQIIVVDDKSDETIVDFNNFPGMGEPCVETVFTKEGRGAGYARNVGMERATGKWILFSDADDFFCPGLLDTLDRYKDNDAEVVVFDWLFKDSDTLETLPKYEQFISRILSGKMSANLLLSISLASWRKMVRKEFLISHGITFEEVTYSNDVWWSKMVAVYAQKICVSDTFLYVYTKRRGSLMMTKSPYVMWYRYCVARNTAKVLQSMGKEEHLSRNRWGWEFREFGYKYYIHYFAHALHDGMLIQPRKARKLYQQAGGYYKYPFLYAIAPLFISPTMKKFIKMLIR